MRLFFDSNVLTGGIVSRWGLDRALLSLCAARICKLVLARQGLVRQMPQLAETLRASLLERYLTCGKPNCKCARGERHGPNWYWSSTLGPGQTAGGKLGEDQVEQVRRWIENYRPSPEAPLKAFQTVSESSLPAKPVAIEVPRSPSPRFAKSLRVFLEFPEFPLTFAG